MKLKKIVARLVIIVGMVSLLGGCGMSKETLTKEQQDNVVKGIIRNYNVESIEFTKFSKDLNTGHYHLLFIINNNQKYKTGITISKKEELDENLDIGLSPISDFNSLERYIPLENVSDITSSIEVIYLGE